MRHGTEGSARSRRGLPSGAFSRPGATFPGAGGGAWIGAFAQRVAPVQWGGGASESTASRGRQGRRGRRRRGAQGHPGGRTEVNFLRQTAAPGVRGRFSGQETHFLPRPKWAAGPWEKIGTGDQQSPAGPSAHGAWEKMDRRGGRQGTPAGGMGERAQTARRAMRPTLSPGRPPPLRSPPPSTGRLPSREDPRRTPSLGDQTRAPPQHPPATPARPPCIPGSGRRARQPTPCGLDSFRGPR